MPQKSVNKLADLCFTPNGTVVNEAMAAGLPVLVSRYCGCYPELCREGVNGFGFDPTRPRDIALAMLRLSQASADTRSRMASASVSIVSSYTIDAWSTGFIQCCQAALGQRS